MRDPEALNDRLMIRAFDNKCALGISDKCEKMVKRAYNLTHVVCFYCEKERVRRYSIARLRKMGKHGREERVLKPCMDCKKLFERPAGQKKVRCKPCSGEAHKKKCHLVSTTRHLGITRLAKPLIVR